MTDQQGAINPRDSGRQFQPINPIPAAGRRRMPLHTKILIGLLVGAVAGVACNAVWTRPLTPGMADAFDTDGNGVHDGLDWAAVNIADPVGKVFLRLLFMVVVPLVFSALTVGVYGLGDIRKLGRVGLRTLAFTVALSVIAVGLGIGLVNLVRPGGGLTAEQQEILRANYAGKAGELVQKAKQLGWPILCDSKGWGHDDRAAKSPPNRSASPFDRATPVLQPG